MLCLQSTNLDGGEPQAQTICGPDDRCARSRRGGGGQVTSPDLPSGRPAQPQWRALGSDAAPESVGVPTTCPASASSLQIHPSVLMRRHRVDAMDASSASAAPPVRNPSPVYPSCSALPRLNLTSSLTVRGGEGGGRVHEVAEQDGELAAFGLRCTRLGRLSDDLGRLGGRCAGCPVQTRTFSSSSTASCFA
jgi:hypothetical protein